VVAGREPEPDGGRRTCGDLAASVLLHAGCKIILLLSAYDKSKDPEVPREATPSASLKR